MADDIHLFPYGAERPEQIKGFIRATGEVFHIGDRVKLIHKGTGSTLFGTLGGTYGVGRIRGFKVEGVPFTAGGKACYPMGQDGDEERYDLHLIERGIEAYETGRSWYVRTLPAGALPWDDLPPATQETYIRAAAKEKIRA